MQIIPRIIPIALLLAALILGGAAPLPETVAKVGYKVPRPAIGGLHIGMSQDSVDIVLKKIALRKNSFKLDSMTFIETDSVRLFAEPAYVRIGILRGKVRSLVVNFHPLSGDHYLNTRNFLQQYMEQFFGRGVVTKDESVVYRRWENEDGTMEVSFTDKYMRVFMRLGKG